MRLRVVLLGLMLAGDLTIAASAPRPAAAPPPGVLILTPLTFYPRLCLGERAAIDILVTDAVYGAPPGGASVILSSSLGGADTSWTPGGIVRLNYEPRVEGSDSILISAAAPNSAPGIASLPARVDRCRWTWDLIYTGTYPHPEGFWQFSEQATVTAGTLETEASDQALKGSGTVAYSINAHGEVTQASCDLGELSGTTTVNVTGVIGPPPGSMMLHFAFDPAPIRGSASFNCRFGPDRVDFVIPVSEAQAALSVLPLEPAIVRTDFGTLSRSVSTAVFWLVPGNGRLTLIVTRASDT